MFSTGNFKNSIGEGEKIHQPHPRDFEYEAEIAVTIQLGMEF